MKQHIIFIMAIKSDNNIIFFYLWSRKSMKLIDFNVLFGFICHSKKTRRTKYLKSFCERNASYRSRQQLPNYCCLMMPSTWTWAYIQVGAVYKIRSIFCSLNLCVCMSKEMENYFPHFAWCSKPIFDVEKNETA